MAQYNADIRIGVTGKTQLNQLEKQLERTQTKLKKLNKELNLRAKVQTIKVNTKGATTAIRALEDRINKLGRTVTINVRQNEKGGRGSGSGSGVGGSGLGVSLGIPVSQQKQQAKAVTATGKAFEGSVKTKEEVLKGLAKLEREQIEQAKLLNEKVAKRNSLLDDQAEKVKKITDVETSRNRTATQNLKFGGKEGRSPAQAQNDAELSIKQSGRAIKQLGTEIRKTEGSYARLNKAAYSFGADERRRMMRTADAFDAYQKKVDAAAAKRQNRAKAGKGAAAGLAVSGLSIPGLQGATGGAIAGAAVGGKGGAIAGGLVGLAVDLTKGFIGVTTEVTKFYNAIRLSQLALANTVDTSEELKAAFTAIEGISDDFLVPVADATSQFTKLNAAARANGFTVQEVEKVYRGLAAANIALGGDATKLNGILLATQQIFSKGSVQSEELKGQIGERLAGAFAKFATASGKSTKQLAKDLELGKVKVEDFVDFTDYLLKEYGENAKIIGDSPANAAARLKKIMDDLKLSLGPILSEIGNAFLTLGADIAKGIQKGLDKLYELRMWAANKNVNDTSQRFDSANETLANLEAKRRNSTRRNNTRLNSQIRNATERANNAQRAFEGATADLEKEKGIQTGITEATGKPKPPKQPLVVEEEKEKKRGGRAPAGPQDRTAELRIALQLQKELNKLQLDTVIGNQLDVEKNQQKLEIKRLLLESEAERQRIELENTTAESKKLANLVREAELEGELNALAAEDAQRVFDRQKDLEANLRGLQEQIDVEGALTEETKLQAEWAARIAELQASGSYEPAEKVAIEAKLNQLYSQRLALLDPLVQYQRELERNLGDTRGQIASLARTIETELGSALSNAITGLIDGTTTVQEAFGNMFANIGKAFIDMAAQMLAQKAILSLLSAFTSGGGMGSGGGYFDKFTGLGTAGPNFGLATGGTAEGGQPYTVGEAGPELFIPGVTGTVTSNDQFEAARNAMGGGGGSTNEEAFAENSNSITTTNSYMRERSMENSNQTAAGPGGSVIVETQVINNVEYASVDQVQAAAAGAAKQARAQVFSDLRNRPASRAQIGMR